MAVLVHTALVASIGAFAVVLLFFRSQTLELTPGPPPSPRLIPALAAIGLGQFAMASWIGRGLLKSRRSGAGERVRLYFLLRASAAEAIGLFGLAAGLLGSPAIQTLALFMLSVAAMLISAPTRRAWERAVRSAESPGP
ncbi:MAG: hypothetical protein ABI968_06740 [Acidobacteriota bacterium]